MCEQHFQDINSDFNWMGIFLWKSSMSQGNVCLPFHSSYSQCISVLIKSFLWIMHTLSWKEASSKLFYLPCQRGHILKQKYFFLHFKSLLTFKWWGKFFLCRKDLCSDERKKVTKVVSPVKMTEKSIPLREMEAWDKFYCHISMNCN